jgi:hypothetical protein
VQYTDYVELIWMPGLTTTTADNCRNRQLFRQISIDYFDRKSGELLKDLKDISCH